MSDMSEKAHKFHQLQQKYTQQLPTKLSQILACWKDFLQQNNQAALQELKRLVHNLAGSAGTFHFSHLSTQARNLEQQLLPIETTEQLPETLDEIDNVLKNIHSLVEKGPDVVLSAPTEMVLPHRRPERLVYVVEDDQNLAEEINQQLQFFGYQVETFHDATTALEHVKQTLPTAMIIDVQLPEGSLAGTALAQRFHSFSKHKIPLMFISVRDDWDARLEAVRSGGQFYLLKPLDFSELLECLDVLTRIDEQDPYRILIVDDMEVLSEHYALVLQSAGMSTHVINEPNNLFEPLHSFKPELILMDLNMPTCSGTEAAKVIRQKEEFTSIPIVYLSTESNHERQMNAMRLGGDDFLQKPITDEDLKTAVSIRAERFRRIRALMNRDSLTGLLNHATLKMYLDTETSRARRHQTHLSFAILDIDHFKAVNDTYGHPMGDRVLKSISRLLSQRLRKSDIIGRYGGEEFAIVFPETPINTAMKVLDGLRQQFSEIIHVHKNARFSCTFSAGISALPPHTQSADDLVCVADEALYQAKHGGRNQVICTHSQ